MQTSLTPRGVFLNLKESDLFAIVNDITFYFSSRYNRDRFLIQKDKIPELNEKQNKIYAFKFHLDPTNLYLIRAYCKIEKRGFRIIFEGNEVDCLNNLKLEYQLKIKK